MSSISNTHKKLLKFEGSLGSSHITWHYNLPCSCGLTYICQTRHFVYARLNKHIIDIQHNKVQNSTVVEFCLETKLLGC